MALGYVTRQALLKKYTLPEFKERIAPRFPAISTIGVLGIVFVAMPLKAKTILADPGQLLMIFIPLLILYLVNFPLPKEHVGHNITTQNNGM
jgi:ACR3 family arsenite efflux pump ArsB